MRTSVFTLFVTLGLVVVAVGPSVRPAVGCAIIWRPTADPVEVAAERALVIWEPEYKTQHFIRAAQFRGGNAEDFAFLVPTPTKPELAVADNMLFDRLEDVTKPREIWTTVTQTIPCRSKFAMVGSAIPASAIKEAAPRVDVLNKQTVGSLEAAVLKANDAAALNTWLATNGYPSRPALQTWLAKYVQNGWIITAFKMKPGANAGNAVRLSFNTEKPFYPYREPADAKPPAGAKAIGRKLKLFLLADVRLKATHDDPAVSWLGHTVWAGKLPVANFTFTNDPKLAGSEPILARGKTDWTLTEYEDTSDPRPASDELSFAPSDDQSDMERPPIQRVRTEYVEDCPTGIAAVAEWPATWILAGGSLILVLALAGFVILRKRLR